MKKAKRKYDPPVMTKVKFEDKELVAFHVCKKQSQIERDASSCCNILPFNQFNLSNLDPS